MGLSKESFERWLEDRIEMTVIRVGWTNGLRREVRDLLYDAALRAKGAGLDVARLVPVFFPGARLVMVYPADLDEKGLNVQIVNFVRFHPQVPMQEVASAFAEVYPALMKRRVERINWALSERARAKTLEAQVG